MIFEAIAIFTITGLITGLLVLVRVLKDVQTEFEPKQTFSPDTIRGSGIKFTGNINKDVV